MQVSFPPFYGRPFDRDFSPVGSGADLLTRRCKAFMAAHTRKLLEADAMDGMPAELLIEIMKAKSGVSNDGKRTASLPEREDGKKKKRKTNSPCE